MNQYYLMAQLPSLDQVNETGPLPITEERFDELCSRLLGKKAQRALNALTLSPGRQPEIAGNRLVDSWCDNERRLRMALGTVRATKLKKTFEVEEPNMLSAPLLQVARTAVDMDNPLEAERYLNAHRLQVLESLRPSDPFSEDAVYYYGLKLKLILRMRRFDESKGNDAYRNIYDSIMRGEDREVK